jgi:hypothetical protein
LDETRDGCQEEEEHEAEGNQGKNAGDVMANAEEAVHQNHNHDSAPNENYNGADADDVMSFAEERAPPCQNHERTSHVNQNVANADEAISDIGELVSFYMAS